VTDPQTQTEEIEAGLKHRICYCNDLNPLIKPPELESGQIEKPHFAPNISLNFLNPEKHSSAVRDGQPRKLRAVQAAFAVTVQAGVLAFFGVLTFRLNLSAGAGRPSPKVGFGLTFSGTIFLVLGLFICATVIE
jgi:hypothetical protein